jgi:peroxiredoxin
LNLTHSDTLPDVQAFVTEFHMTFPILLDKDGQVTERLYQIPGVPTSIFVNRDGTIERVQVGVMTGQQVDRYVAEILK